MTRTSMHARIRGQQRGIPSDVLELVAELGEPVGRSVHGADRLMLKRSLTDAEIRAHGYFRDVAKARDVVVVLSHDGVKITAYHRS